MDYFKAEAALSKFGSSEELIDLAAEDLVCLPLGEVSDDRPPAFYPPRVAANLRRRDSVLIRPLALSRAAPLSPSPLWMLPQNGHLWPTLEMSLESVINECDGEIITQNKIIDQAGKLLSLKNVWPEESYLILSGNMAGELMQHGGACLRCFHHSWEITEMQEDSLKVRKVQEFWPVLIHQEQVPGMIWLPHCTCLVV